MVGGGGGKNGVSPSCFKEGGEYKKKSPTNELIDSLFNLSMGAAQVHQLINDTVGWYVLNDEMP